MRPVSLPSHLIHELVLLLTLPETSIQALIEKVDSTAASSSSLVEFIHEQADTENAAVIGALVLLHGHYRSLPDQPLTTRQFTEWIIQAVVSEHQSLNPSHAADTSKLELLKDLIQRVFFPDFPLGRLLKSNDLITFNERNFTRVRIVSDIRPMFRSDDQVSKPMGALVVHNLNLVFQRHVTGTYEEIFVSLDNEELLEIKNCVDRAIVKSEYLSQILDLFETAGSE